MMNENRASWSPNAFSTKLFPIILFSISCILITPHEQSISTWNVKHKFVANKELLTEHWCRYVRQANTCCIVHTLFWHNQFIEHTHRRLWAHTTCRIKTKIICTKLVIRPAHTFHNTLHNDYSNRPFLIFIIYECASKINNSKIKI